MNENHGRQYGPNCYPADVSEAHMEMMLDRAARRGADEALHRLGIDEHNIHEVRNMLEILHAIKTGALSAISKLVMILMLGGIMAIASFYGWFGK